MSKTEELSFTKKFWFLGVRDARDKVPIQNPEVFSDEDRAATKAYIGCDILGPCEWEAMRSMKREGVGRWIDRARARRHRGTSTLQ